MEQLIRQCGKGIKCTAADYLPGLKALHHPCDLFSGSQPEEGRQRCILINGVPNIGKSYFCRQLTKEILEGQAHSNRIIPLLCKVDWESMRSLNERSPTSHTQARGEDSTSRNCGTQGEAESPRSDPCPLRELLGIIAPRCISSEEIDIPAICNHFTESQDEEIVLICDLVEGESLEFEEPQGLVPKTVIQPLLKNLTSFLPHCTLLLASRPDRVAELMKTLGKIKIRPHLFVEVLGFTRTSVDAFVDQRNREVLKRLLKQFTWLYSVCRVPKVVNDLCKISTEWNPVSDEPALAKLCKCIGLPVLPSREEHQECSKLTSLCKKAFNCLVTSHQQSYVLFKDPPWSLSLPTPCSSFLCLDVVKDCRFSMEPFPVYYYASDAVQEYLAALHVASLSDLQLLKTAAERCATVLPSDSTRLKQVLLFFSALSKSVDHTEFFIDAYLGKREENVNETSSVLNHKIDPWHLACCLYEAKNESLLKRILPFKKNQCFSNFSIPIHSQYDMNVIYFLLKHNYTCEEGQNQPSEVGSQVCEGGSQQTEDGSRVNEGGSQQTEDGSRVNEGGSQQTEDGSRVNEGGSQQTEDGSRVNEGGSQQTEDGSRVNEGGSQQTEDGSRVNEGGSQQTEDGSRVSEGGSQQTEDGRQVNEGGSQQTEDGSRVSEGGHQQTEDGRQQTTDDVITVEFMEDLHVMENSLVPQWENLGPSIISFSHPPPEEHESCESTCVR